MKRRLLSVPILISFLLINITGQPAERVPLTAGDAAPDFTLADIEGKTHSLMSYRGKTVAIAFIATQCPISNDYIDRLQSISEEYSKRGVVFIGINSNITEPVAEIKAHAATHKLSFPIIKDEGNKIADAFGAERTPEMFVIDAKGFLQYHGRIDNSRDPVRVNRHDLREALNELLAGKPVSIPEGKAFGCPIKRTQDLAAIKASDETFKDFNPKIGLIKPADFNKFRESAKGKVLVVNFWATWCGPCVAEFPEFVAIDTKYRDKGVKVTGISADETADIKTKVVPFVKEQKAMFEILVQDTEDPQEMIDVVNKDWQGSLPATFVYDREGKNIFKRFGIIDRDELIEVIEKALK